MTRVQRHLAAADIRKIGKGQNCKDKAGQSNISHNENYLVCEDKMSLYNLTVGEV